MPRPVLIFCVALLMFSGSLVTVGAAQQQYAEQVRGYEDPFTASALPERVPRLGINVDLRSYDAAALADQIAALQAAGVTWIRQVFDWSQLEPAPEQFDWTTADRVVNAVAAAPDLRLIAVLVNSPAWTRTGDRAALTVTAPPDDPTVFGVFAARFAARYADTIDFYQIWDEPNLTAAWGGGQPRPADYAALLAAGYIRIHAADPVATVIAAALAPTTEVTLNNLRDDLYLDALYRMGAAPYFDAAAGKPFGFSTSPTDRTVSPDVLNFSRLILLREVMHRHNDAATPLWGSAFGWNHLPPDWTGEPSIWGSVTADQQIAYTLAALDRVETEWPWLGGLILSEWEPPLPADHPWQGFAIRPASPLYTALTERAANQPTAAGIGWYPPTTRHATYSGLWTFGALGTDIGWVQDSRLTFTFSGTRVGLRLREDDYVAFLYPTIDGQTITDLPRDNAGNAYINLTSGTRSPELTTPVIADNLPSGVHTLRVTADRGWDRWALAGYVVGGSPPGTAYQQQVILAGVLVVTSGLALVLSAARVNWRPLFQRPRRVWNALGNVGQLAISAVTSVALMVGLLLSVTDALPGLFRREPPLLIAALLTGGLLYLAPHTVIALVAGAALFVIVYQRLALGLLLTIVFAPFFLFPVELFRFAFPMAELVLLITAAAWALRGLVAWGRYRQTTPSAGQQVTSTTLLMRQSALDWGVIAFVGLGSAAFLWSADRGAALTELRTLFIEPALFYAIYRTTRPTRADLLRLIDGLLLAGALVCVVGLFLYIRGDAIITAEDGARRLASVYGSPNNVALLLGRCLPFALAFALLPVDRRRRGLAIGLVGLFTVTLILTQSAGGLFVGVPAAVIAVLLFSLGRRALLPVIGLGLLGGVGAAIAVQTSERFARLLSFSEGTNFFRLRVWESTINMLRDHPLTGLGLDQFLYAFRGRYLLPDAWQEPNLSHPHNLILDHWVRLGIGGVILLIALQVVFWRALVRAYRAATDPLTHALTVGTMAAMIALLAHGLVDNSIFVLDLAYIFIILLCAAHTLDPKADALPNA